MILNPSHEITRSGLPSDVLNAYVRYKKGSRAIVAWLTQFGPANYKGSRTLPIKELAGLARGVSKQITQLPDVVHFHFKETISARKCLSKYFRENRDEIENDLDTVNHEHFTNSLSEIYQELCHQCQMINDESRRSRSGNSVDVVKSLHNHYHCLPVEDIALTDNGVSSPPTDCENCSQAQSKSGSKSENHVSIEGDEIAVAIENVIQLDSAQNTFAAIEHLWTQAGTGRISFVAAAGATNAAWESLRKVACELQNLNRQMSIQAIHRQCYPSQIQSTTSESPQSATPKHRLLSQLEGLEHRVKHVVEVHKLDTMQSNASNVQKPADYIQKADGPDSASCNKLQDALLDNVLHLILKTGGCPALMLSSTPCLTEIGRTFSNPDDEMCRFWSVLAVHLLVTTYKAFISTCLKPSLVSMCRISSLRLAQQAATSLGAVLADKHAFPCQCPQTLAFHLSNLEHDLNTFGKHKCWNLYFQSPWVAGTHTIEILDVLSYYGMRLFHYRHYVGSVVHVYNVVQQLGGLERIPVLDEILDTFADVFFPAGGRPSSNFKNSWSRFVGARLRFKRGHKGHNHRESWCMAVPAHAAKTAAGFSSSSKQDALEPKFDYGRFDPLIRLKQGGYRLMNGFDRDTRPKEQMIKSRSSSSSSSSFTRDSRSTSISSISTALSSPSLASSIYDTAPTIASKSRVNHSALEQVCYDLNDSLITAREQPPTTSKTTSLNLLAIFMTCTKIVSKISDQVHVSAEERKDNQNCICYGTTLLAGADRIIDGRRMGHLECWRKEERRVVDIVKNAITEVMAEVENNRRVWYWDI